MSANLDTYNRLLAGAEIDKSLTSDKSRDAMYECYTDDFEIVEPPTLPHGGVWKGRDEWVKMNQKMGSLWSQQLRVLNIWDLPEDDLVILKTEMDWTAKETGKTITFPATELLWFRDAKISRVEMYLQDTKAILDTLEP